MVAIVMGVSGSGKTTIGRALARAAGGRFHDADDFHSDVNIAKMRGGTPLSELDREPWLRTLRECIDRWLEEPGLTVLACSALTRRSRVLLGAGRPGVRLVFLRAPKAAIEARMRGRDHFMPPSLLQSQFDALEPPDDALVLDATAPPEILVEQALACLGQS
ncbi:MAG: gluconokinase [Acidobacteriota bacterium]